MKTTLIDVTKPSQADKAIEQADALLSQGGLVAFPTETVYGVAANVNRQDSLKRLSELKERPANPLAAMGQWLLEAQEPAPPGLF